MRRSLLLTAFLFISTILFAQKGKIEGKVIDSKSGLPLSGVTVLLKGTAGGVATGTDGRYVINATGPKATLVFSYN
ncbi:MAG: hypothetical protein EOO20_24870, partial [Chryseobacterium sp.]